MGRGHRGQSPYYEAHDGQHCGHSGGHRSRSRCKYEERGSFDDEDVYDFGDRFPMDDRAFDFLMKSPADVKATVLSEFRPGRRANDYSALVTNFVGQVTRRLEREDHHRKDYYHPRDARHDQEFHDRGGRHRKERRRYYPSNDIRDQGGDRHQEESRDESRHRHRNGRHHDSRRERSVHNHRNRREHDHRESRRDGHTRHHRSSYHDRTSRDQGYSRRESDRSLHQFRDQYPIDEKAFQILQSAHPKVRDIVVSRFKPKREGEDDYSALVMGFVRSIAERQGLVQDRRDGRRDTDNDSVADDDNSRCRPQHYPDDDGATDNALESFRLRYPMDNKAFDFLADSSEDVQNTVMNDFKPKREGERDYSALIMTLVKLVRTRKGQRSGDTEAGYEKNEARHVSHGDESNKKADIDNMKERVHDEPSDSEDRPRSQAMSFRSRSRSASDDDDLPPGVF